MAYISYDVLTDGQKITRRRLSFDYYCDQIKDNRYCILNKWGYLTLVHDRSMVPTD